MMLSFDVAAQKLQRQSMRAGPDVGELIEPRVLPRRLIIGCQAALIALEIRVPE
jgi:hypothetical protein